MMIRESSPYAVAAKPSRLGEANQVGRYGHLHVMPSAQQLTAHNDRWLDIAARSVARQHKFHRDPGLSIRRTHNICDVGLRTCFVGQ